MIPAPYQSGELLYGDDLSEDQIAKWYADEETAYSQLPVAQGQYAFEAFNEFHVFRMLRKSHFETCLALGCFDGADILPIAENIGQIIGIEPDENVWRSHIGKTPAQYMKPTVRGDIDLPDNSVDLVTCFGVLHHIPNTSHVLAELIRVLRPGGVIVIRETCSSMGDWTKPRVGLTTHERGLSWNWLKPRLNGVNITRNRNLMWHPTYKLKKLLRAPFNHRVIVFLDWLASELTAWNNRYWRDRKLDFFSPTSRLIIGRKI